MENSVKTFISKVFKTKLTVLNDGPLYTFTNKNVEIEVSNPKNNVVCLNFIFDNKDHIYEMTADRARIIGNMLFNVANEAKDEWASMRQPFAATKPTKESTKTRNVK